MTEQPEEIKQALVNILEEFEESLKAGDLREQILKLVPANILIRKLGMSLDGLDHAASARYRILSYIRDMWEK